jgi:very-short-patch-repair endonuclease
VTNTGKAFRATCGACRNEYRPMWDNIRSGRSLTCGCCTNRISRGQSELADFIRSLGIEVRTEHKVGELAYDIAIESKRLLIEYNGLKWHSGHSGRRRDKVKHDNASAHGWDMVMLFEDEWMRHKEKVEALIKNKLGLLRPTAIRPAKCEVRLVRAGKADEFYETFHYIGAAKAPINYVAFHDGRAVAAVSFKRPTRQSSHPWELVRMASDPAFRVHGIWHKMFRQFVRSQRPSSVVSFSDNRLFGGGIYVHLGFVKDGEISADYYWCKNQRRWHKSGLRKKPEERDSGLTEAELRTKQGYYRVWDLGKKRWVWTA